MYQLQLLLPLYDNEKQAFPPSLYSGLRDQLLEMFGGITAYTRSPARGLWKEDEEKVVRDEIIIYEIMLPELDRGWWQSYKEHLKGLFSQEEIVVRVWKIETI